MTLLRHPLLPAVEQRDGVDRRVFAVQRLGAVLVGGTLLVFGLLGSTTGVPLLATHGARVLGLSSNGLLSALSLVVAAILFWAAVRGGGQGPGHAEAAAEPELLRAQPGLLGEGERPGQGGQDRHGQRHQGAVAERTVPLRLGQEVQVLPRGGALGLRR